MPRSTKMFESVTKLVEFIISLRAFNLHLLGKKLVESDPINN